MMINAKSKSLVFVGVVMGLASAIACAPERTERKGPPLVSQTNPIVGGKVATSVAPEAASTVLIIGKTGRCTGTLIARDLVLTAAHCVVEDDQPQTVLPPEEFILLFGSAQVDLEGKWKKPVRAWAGARATRIVSHEYYAELGETENSPDVALIQFKSGLPEMMRPATILPPALSAALSSGSRVTVAGFGKTTIDDQMPKLFLRKVEVRVNDGTPRLIWLNSPDFASRGVCSGDSGGPAFVSVDGIQYLFGVNSMADKHCKEDSIVVNLLGLHGWLARQAAELGTSIPSLGDAEDIERQETNFWACLRHLSPKLKHEVLDATNFCWSSGVGANFATDRGLKKCLKPKPGSSFETRLRIASRCLGAPLPGVASHY